MSKTLLFLTVFSLGYVMNDILRENNINLVGAVYAEVDGMNYMDLRIDRDFRIAVEYLVEDLVEDCSVEGGYVDDGYVYGASISC